MSARLFAVASVSALLLASSGDPAAAQSGSPTADAQGTADCSTIEPRDAAFFDSLAGTPAAETDRGAEGQAAPSPFAMPEGEAADEAVVAEVTTLYAQLLACLNAGDYLRAYALYSDEYLIRNLTEEAIERLAATPVPTDASMQTSFGSVLDARLLQDGRVAALVTLSNPQSGDIVLLATLRKNGDRLLIDEEQIVEAAVATPASAATPAA
jgi:hypothetical protein